MEAIAVGCSCTDESCYLAASVDLDRGKLVVKGLNHGKPTECTVVLTFSDDGLRQLYAALQDKFSGPRER